MSQIAAFHRSFIMAEAIVESFMFEPHHDVLFNFKVTPCNMTREFAVDLGLPPDIRTDEDSKRAFAVFEQVIPNGRLQVALRNVARFELDRWRRHPDGEALLTTLGAKHTRDSWDSVRTIYGFSFKESSPLLDELGGFKSRFHHVAIDLTDAHIDVVFECLDLLNYRAPFIRA